MLPLISLTLGLSFLSGLNLYLATFLTSLGVHQGWIEPALHPAVAALGHPAVMVVSLFFFLTEFVMDKIPWVDSLWDGVHTIIRPIGAVILSLVLLDGAGLTSEGGTALIAALGGIIALSTHLTKTGVRLLLNASPEPFTNILASLAEDVAVASLVLLLLHAPVTGFGACLALLAGTWIVLPRLLRVVKTTLYLTWKKFSAAKSPTCEPQKILPAHLTAAQENQLRDLLKSGEAPVTPTAAWTVPCVTGKIRQMPSLRANRFGTLVSPADHPGTLAFLYQGWFRPGSVRLSLVGCTIRQETSMLSENLVIHHPEEGLQLVFRFIRSEAGLVSTLVSDLRRRLGLEAPALLASTQRSLPVPLLEPATQVWTAPQSWRH